MMLFAIVECFELVISQISCIWNSLSF